MSSGFAQSQSIRHHQKISYLELKSQDYRSRFDNDACEEPIV
jgi:hypothetical protein